MAGHRGRLERSGWKTDFDVASIPLGEIESGGPPKDGIPAVDAPAFETIEAARSWLDPRSPVIGLDVAGESRAYPMAIITWHEIVNDSVGDQPVVITFCPLCNTALVFDRTVDGDVLDFGTTGRLYLSNLVMYDRQTETWWLQATGAAVVGARTGDRLRSLPSQIVSLDDFGSAYPSGAVMSRQTGHSRPYGRNPYPGYDRADEQPFLYSGRTDGRIAPKERVATVGEGDQAIAFAYADLERTGVATETVDGEPIVVFWAPGTRSALDASVIDESRDAGTSGVFSPIVEGELLSFERSGPPGTPITDRQTESTWSVTGIATSGLLAGERLTRITAGDHLWFSWAAFNPGTRVWQPAPDPRNDIEP